ncbi:ferredoxin family protein [Sporolactobacillus sp. KGMB 08714]|uniref:ferredoxin family protein n=1 Tax=Sporolactobacillus sp. KGMB 08714 TaxID=3064704 RepID=UPI002FBE6B13
MNTVDVDEKLNIDKFNVDEDNAHIVLKQDEIDSHEFQKLIVACPANCYRVTENGEFHFDYAGCLECGTCRVLCGKTILKKWEFPQGTMGVEYRYG